MAENTEERNSEDRHPDLTNENGRALSPTDEVIVCAQFLSGVSSADLAKHWDLALNTIRRTLERHGIKAEHRQAIEKFKPEQPKGMDENVRAEYQALGELAKDEDDPFAAARWLVRALQLSAQQLIRDPDITAERLRKELRDIGKTISAIFPVDAMAKVKRQMEREADDYLRGKGPELENAPHESRRPNRSASS